MKKKKLPTKLIVNNENKLREQSENFKSSEFDEALEIGHHLLLLCQKLNGAGLAAPQIGIYKRVFVVNVLEPIIMINGFCMWHSDSKIDSIEGCLSFPGKKVKTRRSKWVKMAYVDENLQSVVKLFGQGLDTTKMNDKIQEAIACQHESDHCDGKLIFDQKVENFL